MDMVAMRPKLLFAVLSSLVLAWKCHGHGESADQCPAQQLVYGKALKGFTFKTLVSTSEFECLVYCHYEDKCQSYNYVTKTNICEMNNRTKEAKPDQFVSDPNRFYAKRGAHRKPLGSIPTLPAQSCREIKANEGEQAVSGNSWLDPTGSGEVILAYCNMNTEDFCVNSRCQNEGLCVTGQVNYTCECGAGWTGSYCEIEKETDFQASTILSAFGGPTYVNDLTQFLEPVLQGHNSYTWVKCYHAMSDGWEALTFHSLCDGKGPTLVIIRVNDYIFGGFTSVSWRGNGCSFSADSQAFIFSLYNTMGYHPMKLTQTHNLDNAIYRCSNEHVVFGGGRDLHISSDASSSSYTRPRTYLPPNGCDYNLKCTVFAGSFYFTPSDIEVFYLSASSV